MRLSLLTPPTESPRDVPHVPIPTGWPGEREIAVDTSGLPRSLHLAAMDPATVTGPFEAMSRFGATGAAVSTEILGTVLHAQAKKQETQDLNDATLLYTQTAEKIDTQLEELKTSADHRTLRPLFDAMWNKEVTAVLQSAPNDVVRQHVALKLAGYRVTQSADVARTTRAKLVDYQEASLATASEAFKRMATDPDADDPTRKFALDNLKSYYVGVASTGMFPPDRLHNLQERYLTTTYNEIARQTMTKDPAAFLPKDSDENGQDGYQDFGLTGKYPADPKFLDSLLERAPKLIEHRETQVRMASERREKAQTKAMDIAANSGYDQLMDELASGDLAKVTEAAARAPEFRRQYGAYLTTAQKNDMRDRERALAKEGGVTSDHVYNALSARIHEFPGSVPEDEIRQARIDGYLATEGERSSKSLIDKQRQLLKGDDASQRPDYIVGRNLIAIGLGSGITDMTAAQFQALAPENISEHNLWRSRALEEYDRKARSPEWKDKDLRELGAQVRDAYYKIIYDRAASTVVPPAPKPAAPATPSAPAIPSTAPATPAAPSSTKPKTGPSSWLDYILPKPFVPPSP